MKKLLIGLVCVTNTVFSQNISYSKLREFEVKFLQKHKIDYVSPSLRVAVFSNHNDAKSFVKAYNNFITWNNNVNKIIPDTLSNITGLQFIQDKLPNPDLEFIFGLTECYISQSWSVSVNNTRKNIKNIHIVEMLTTTSNSYKSFEHIIMYEDFSGQWHLIPFNTKKQMPKL